MDSKSICSVGLWTRDPGLRTSTSGLYLIFFPKSLIQKKHLPACRKLSKNTQVYLNGTSPVRSDFFYSSKRPYIMYFLFKCNSVALFIFSILSISTLPAYSETFAVNSTDDAHDSNPGDGICAAASGMCTLRAAIEEANAFPGQDVIEIPAGHYLLTEGELRVLDSVFIVGEDAETTLIDGIDNGFNRVVFIRRLGSLMVCDATENEIQRFNPISGKHMNKQVFSGIGGLEIAGAAKIGPDDDLFVAGFSSGIHRYDGVSGFSKGVFVPSSAGGLLGPTDLEFAPFALGGDLYVTSFQPTGGIRRYDSETGDFIEEFISAGEGGLAFPNSLVFGPDRDLYITSTGTHSVLRFDGETGAFVEEFVSAFSGGLSTPRGLTFGPDGHLYVASEDNDQILRYDGSTGVSMGSFVSAGSGGLDEPTDVVFGPDGNLYVLSSETDQILRYDDATGDFIDVFVDDGDGGLVSPSCILFSNELGRGPIVNMSNITVQNGQGGTLLSGGGIYVFTHSSLTLTDSVVRNNASRAPGAGLANGGTMQLRRVAVTGNSLPLEAGGGTQYSGGGLMNFSGATMKIDQSTISGNEATRGGGLRNAGGRLEIENSTISGNTANARGGGIMNFGVASITYTTITNNTANAGANSEPLLGGGIYNTGDLFLGNSILAGNTDNRNSTNAEYSPDCWSGMSPSPGSPVARFTSFRGNLVGILNENCELRDTIWGDTRFDQVGSPDSPLNPLLGPLANNGGPLQTHEPLPGSPAIDEGTGISSATFFDCPEDDQREFLRAVDGDSDGDADCDVGAVEVGAMPAPEEMAAVTSFTLIDAGTDLPIPAYDPIPNGVNIMRSILPNQVNVRANIDGDPGSVLFSFKGVAGFRTENVAPYALFGDALGNYGAQPLTNGLQTVTATPYSEQGGNGDAGIAAALNFSIVNTTNAITQFILVDATTDNDIVILEDGMTIQSVALPDQVNIRAETGDVVKSVELDLNGQKRTENVTPFAAFGDLGGDYLPKSLNNGSYTLTATPYSKTKKQGSKGAHLTISFTIEDAGSGKASVVMPPSERLDTSNADVLPDRFELEGNYPNPFNPSTAIVFSLPEQSSIRLSIFDILGRQVKILHDGPMPAGRHELIFQAGEIPNGVYFYRLETPAGRFDGQMLLLK